jgi:hypothetical protein
MKELMLILSILLLAAPSVAQRLEPDRSTQTTFGEHTHKPTWTTNWQFIPVLAYSDGDGDCHFHGVKDEPASCAWEVCSNAGYRCVDGFYYDRGLIRDHNCTQPLPAGTWIQAACAAWDDE